MTLTRRQFNLLAGVTALSSAVFPAALLAAASAGTVTEYANEPAVLTQIDRNGPELIGAKSWTG